MDRLKGILTLAAVACPCHLPILLAILSATTIGSVLAANFLPIFVVFGVVFVGALMVGLQTLDTRPGRACPLPKSRITSE